MLTNFKFNFCSQTTEIERPSNTLTSMSKNKNTETEIKRMLKETGIFLDKIKNTVK